MYCKELDLMVGVDDFVVEEIYWFEGDSDLVDNLILYVFFISKGVKGIMVDVYGIYSGEIDLVVL